MLETACDKSCFNNLEDFFKFSRDFLEFIETGLQARIIAQNETNYMFFQYKKDGRFNISRPLNADLFLTADSYSKSIQKFQTLLNNTNLLQKAGPSDRDNLRKCVYTVPQTVGACLDALPAGESNKARKLTGDYFERFIRLIVRRAGFECSSGWTEAPVKEGGKTLFKMKHQHDLMIKKDNVVRIIGSVKTSSKDRLGKIFIDKLLYSQLAGNKASYVAVFLNDVQRKKVKSSRKYKINSTFLSGHFKGYTVKLNPLDGVYYCDVRPDMVSDEFLKKRIKTIDRFFCEDLWFLTG